jgi:tryptophanyl-tRNA synthetase
MNSKQIYVSGIQPTHGGVPHVGNLVGMLKPAVQMQDQGDGRFYFLADLHALTVTPPAEGLRAAVRSTAASLVAVGLDPERSAIFRQSDVPEHSLLSQVLVNVARTGNLARMTQFKAKTLDARDAAVSAVMEAARQGPSAGKPDEVAARFARMALDVHEDATKGFGAGLLFYPVLMAADILLYKGTHVPVGDDQSQHLQFAGQVARSFNHAYGCDLFPEPEAVLPGVGERIRSLRDPARKMSKSAATQEEVLYITDSPEEAARKIRRATSETEPLSTEPHGLAGRLAATALVGLCGALMGQATSQVLSTAGGHGFSKLKGMIVDAFVEHVVPIGDRYRELHADEHMMGRILSAGAEKAREVASATLDETYTAVGLR